MQVTSSAAKYKGKEKQLGEGLKDGIIADAFEFLPFQQCKWNTWPICGASSFCCGGAHAHSLHFCSALGTAASSHETQDMTVSCQITHCGARQICVPQIRAQVWGRGRENNGSTQGLKALTVGAFPAWQSISVCTFQMRLFQIGQPWLAFAFITFPF